MHEMCRMLKELGAAQLSADLSHESGWCRAAEGLFPPPTAQLWLSNNAWETNLEWSNKQIGGKSKGVYLTNSQTKTKCWVYWLNSWFREMKTPDLARVPMDISRRLVMLSLLDHSLNIPLGSSGGKDVSSEASTERTNFNCQNIVSQSWTKQSRTLADVFLI